MLHQSPEPNRCRICCCCCRLRCWFSSSYSHKPLHCAPKRGISPSVERIRQQGPFLYKYIFDTLNDSFCEILLLSRGWTFVLLHLFFWRRSIILRSLSLTTSGSLGRCNLWGNILWCFFLAFSSTFLWSWISISKDIS